jgi:PTH2 family peptidyl-tRNA hydrolase
MADFTHKLVVVVRKDLNLSKGKLAAQVAHAAVDCALRAKQTQPDAFNAWYRQGQKKVVVSVPDQRSLFAVKAEAEEWNVTASLITDAGHTELEPGTVTCLGVGPGKNDVIDEITGDLPLL